MSDKTICGIDFSINSPGIVWTKTDKEFNVLERKWLTFTNKKKYVNKNVIFISTAKNKRTYSNSLVQACAIRNIIWNWLIDNSKQAGVKQLDYVVFEDYAFAAKGRIFHIAEATMATKLKIFEQGIPIRLYPPNHIKLFATGSGNADKLEMEDAFDALTNKERKGMDVTCLPTLHEQKNGNPIDNIIDAFWVSELLRIELQLRSGILMLRELPEHHIKVFNRISKICPYGILNQPFLINDIEK